MSESDNKVFGFGIGGFSQRHSPPRDPWGRRRPLLPPQCFASRGHGRAPGTLDKSKVDAPTAFLHDIDAFVHASPEYVSYGDILAQHGPELDIEQIANRDMSEADAKLLVPSIIAVARYDRRCVARIDTF